MIDASGTWSTPGPVGADGAPALGERAAVDGIVHRVPEMKDPAVRANQHSCGTVYPHGVNELSHPEKDVYLVGMKS